MKLILAYILVIVLVQFLLTLGSMLAGFPVALLLVWAPARFRCVVAGIIAGVGGVAAAVAFGYFMFRLIVGPHAYGLLPLLASTVPLLVPILNDRNHARQLADVQNAASTGLQTIFAPTTDAANFEVVGEILGLILAFLWFFLIHKNGVV